MKSHQLKENMVQKIIKLLDEYKVPQDEDNEEAKIDAILNILGRSIVFLVHREFPASNHKKIMDHIVDNILNIFKDSEV